MNEEEKAAWMNKLGISVHVKGDWFDMKRMTVLLLASILRLFLAACGKVPESKQSPQEPYTEAADTEGTEEKQHRIELIDPWHLDSEKNL